ncbi:unnamed protein product [Laminaria digitata]
MTTIEMRTFRSQPEKRVTLWMPLRPIASNQGDDFGAIQIAVTYSDDYFAEGYMFGLLCGLGPLGPLWLPSFFSDDIPSMLPSMVDKNLSNRLRSSNPSSPPDHKASAIPANDDVHAADDVHAISAPRTAPVIIPANDVSAADVQAIAAPSRTAPVSVGLE